MSPTLHWKNGDFIVGTLDNSESDFISWQAPQFLSPWQINRASLKQVKFPANYLASSSIEESPLPMFLAILKNGDRIPGNLLAITASSIRFDSLFFEKPVEIPRGQLCRLIANEGPGGTFYGPSHSRHWQSVGRYARETDWQCNGRSRIFTHRWGGSGFRPIQLPEKCEIAFQLSSPNEPVSAEIAFTRGMDSGPKIETWGKHLVLTHHDSYVRLLELNSTNQHLVSLRLFWDRDLGILEVTDWSGKKLGRLVGVTASANSQQIEDGIYRPTSKYATGFRLTNRTAGLSLEHLSVTPRPERLLPSIYEFKSGLVLKSGKKLSGSGSITAASPNQLTHSGNRYD
ncbi:MAG: hypothetical protein AAF226_04855, partial [Verrucomicrobiota bacterium]